jgi:outer membrane immunogenic protein
MRFAGWAAIGAMLAGPAIAADLPAALPQSGLRAASYYEWSGIYLGANTGYRTGTVVGIQEISSTSTTGGITPLAGSNTSSNSKGAFGGIQIGINWQIDKFVFGFEGDLDGVAALAATSSGACLNPTGTVIAGCSFNVDDRLRYFVTFRGRLGYAIDRWLFYITGGAAWQNVGSDISLATMSHPSTMLGTIWNTPVGWTVGSGIEAALMANWSVRVEYLHIQSVDTSASVPVSAAAAAAFSFSPTTTISNSISVKNDIVRLGLNYRFW